MAVPRMLARRITMSQAASTTHAHRSRVTATDAGAVGTTITVTRSIVIMRPVPEVFAYISDFNQASVWRTDVSQSRQEPPPPLVQGARLIETASVLGRTKVTECVVDEVEPGRRFTFRSISGQVQVSGEFQTESVALGTTVTYTLNVILRGAWRWFAPVLRLAGTRSMEGSLRTLCRLLEAGVAMPL
jgi:hypothetical protein